MKMFNKQIRGGISRQAANKKPTVVAEVAALANQGKRMFNQQSGEP
jgi:hypothetical protein